MASENIQFSYPCIYHVYGLEIREFILCRKWRVENYHLDKFNDINMNNI